MFWLVLFLIIFVLLLVGIYLYIKKDAKGESLSNMGDVLGDVGDIIKNIKD
jgi:hypothetical protein